MSSCRRRRCCCRWYGFLLAQEYPRHLTVARYTESESTDSVSETRRVRCIRHVCEHTIMAQALHILACSDETTDVGACWMSRVVKNATSQNVKFTIRRLHVRTPTIFTNAQCVCRCKREVRVDVSIVESSIDSICNVLHSASALRSPFVRSSVEEQQPLSVYRVASAFGRVTCDRRVRERKAVHPRPKCRVRCTRFFDRA